MENTVRQFLEFRKKFTKRQWRECNLIIEEVEREKADKLELDDLDLALISDCE